MACEPPAETPAEDSICSSMLVSFSDCRSRRKLTGSCPRLQSLLPRILLKGKSIHGELAEAEAIFAELRRRLQAVSSERDAAAAPVDSCCQ